MDLLLGHPLHGRRGRHFVVHGAAHDVPGPVVGAGQLRLHHDAGARVLRTHAGAHVGHDRRVRVARSVPVLRDVGGDAHPDVFHHRGVGRGAAPVRRHQVLHLYVFRIAVDAGGDPGARLARRPPDRHLLVLVRVPDRAPGRARARRLLAVRRLLPRVRHQGADVPVSHLAPRRARGGSHRRLGDPRRRAAQDGDVRVPPVRPAAVSGRRTAPRDPGGRGDARTDRDRVRRPGGDGGSGPSPSRASRAPCS